MMTTAPSERCEAYALALSSFLDGELQFPECLPAVDHLASCDACRSFYLEARRLSDRLAGTAVPPAPESAWKRIESADAAARPGRSARSSRARTFRALGLAAAAVLAVAVGVTRFRQPVPSGPAADGASPAPLREIVVEGARGRMTDERFLSLLSELLSADSRYHRETERVLRFVLRREGASPLEERAVSPAEEGEPEDEAGDEPSPRLARTPSPIAS